MTERRHPRASRPSVEVCEPRTLLSTSALLARPAAVVHARAATTAGSIPLPRGQGPQGNATDYFNPTGNPTSHERARESFQASFTGTYVIGNGRYDSQSQSFTFHGAGTGSYFLHGDAQMGLVTPKDTSRPTSGELTMFDRNINTNFAYGIDLSGDRVTGVDRFGRPTRLTYTTDVNISAGLPAESISQGTVRILYLSGGHASRGIKSQGSAIVLVKGRVYTLGTNQILRNANINH